jgi:hypothetical protein
VKIKAPKGLSEDVNPFTKEERDRIITAFETDRYYHHYTNYVRFLFFTGCCPSEAIPSGGSVSPVVERLLPAAAFRERQRSMDWHECEADRQAL